VVNLNGSLVRYSEDGSTAFIPLPRELWREIDTSGCSCWSCSQVAGRKSYWDTLAVATQPKKMGGQKHSKTDHAWTVHNPKDHPDRLREEETSI